MQSSFFIHNRKNLARKLDDGLFVVSAYGKMQRTSDESFDFKQESNFWYLSGIEEPDWLLIYDGKTNKSWLVRPRENPRLVVFQGELSDMQAIDRSGVDEVISMDQMKSLLKKLALQHEKIYTVFPPKGLARLEFTANPALARTRRMLKTYCESVLDCRKDLAELRAIKQSVELAQIQHAITITGQAFEYVAQNINDYKKEYAIEADMSYVFRNHNNATHAYSPIVAGGVHACTLHYNKNSAKISKNNLVLIDVGASINGYNADITRTFAYGQPTSRMVDVFRAVSDAQSEIVAMLRPNLSLHDIQQQVEKIMYKKLQGLGLDKGSKRVTLQEYFPHAIGHGLGIDVHEPLAYGSLVEGMVLTVEPGIYIQSESIGVRIEDNILITKDGHKNLSEHIRKDLVY